MQFQTTVKLRGKSSIHVVFPKPFPSSQYLVETVGFDGKIKVFIFCLIRELTPSGFTISFPGRIWGRRLSMQITATYQNQISRYKEPPEEITMTGFKGTCKHCQGVVKMFREPAEPYRLLINKCVCFNCGQSYCVVVDDVEAWQQEQWKQKEDSY